MKHSYAGLPAFERLLLLIATLLRYPGVGYIDSMQSNSEKSHHKLQLVQLYLQKVASELNVELPLYSRHTIQSDLKTLRRYGLLDRRPYRWGYYIGTAAMNWEELQVALNALHSQARYQEDPQINQIYKRLTQRLRGLNLKDEMFYPVRTQLNRVIVYTDPQEMMAKGKYQSRGTLFEKLDALEAAIVKGQAVELYRYRNPYNPEKTGYEQVYPLQLIYADIAWYLLQENYKDGHLVVSRIDRFSDHFKLLDSKGRGSNIQWKSLHVAHRLLRAGWGLKLGSREDQRREICGELELVQVQVRFFPEVMEFIQEGEKRHPKQDIKPGPKGKDGKFAYVDYIVKLPKRSLEEFCRWVYRFMGNAQFISPQYLAEQQQKFARALIDRYSSKAI
ncbi:YafY family protein [Nostoc sp. LPT]|uniref:helix-turn-helix transcriptional regulator n=1 Tax=Nostoc sp. LPT TaxID=2815387 RepID=UPI001DA8B641|nr:WYL domain-containing protein [Nostoc sp. LPT]MBN4006965.1 WYL domain-containing protein [Nostoc sp. LPT]